MAKKVKDVYAEQAAANQGLDQKYNEAISQAAQARAAAQAENDTKYDEDTKTASDYYRTQYNAGLKTLADIYDAEQSKIRKEAEEAKAREQAAREAGVWTGATNFAASLVNLFGVANGAANQTYKSPSLDWMKQADTIRREGKVRMDQLAERQKAVQMQIEQMKLADAKQGLADARQGAITKYNSRNKAAEQAYKDRVAAATNEYKAGQRAAELEAKGQIEQIKLNQRQVQAAAALKAKGFNADGSVNKEAMAVIQQIKESKSGGNGGKSPLPFMDKDGNINLANLTNAQKEQVWSVAKAALKLELSEEEYAKYEKELRMATTDKDKADVVTGWMGKSPTVGEALRQLDSSYSGNHGEEETAVTEQEPVDNKKGKSTKDLIDAL